MGIKDNILVKDHPCTAGSKILDSFVAPVDATVVQRLKAAGAIILGKTNLDEFGMGSFGHYGHKGTKVKNPLNIDYYAGGSSAGSAASVADDMVMGALGTDTGGSVLFPAHCCGLASFKPSYGRLSRYGVILYSSSNDCVGIFGKSVSDVLSQFKIMDGSCPNDSNCVDFKTDIERFRYKERLSMYV